MTSVRTLLRSNVASTDDISQVVTTSVAPAKLHQTTPTRALPLENARETTLLCTKKLVEARTTQNSTMRLF